LESNTIKASDFMVSAGDVLIAMTGATIGKFCIVPYLQNNTYVNQRVGKFFLGNDPIKKLPFLYNTLKQGKVLSEIISKGQGSAQPNISGLDIENISIIQPTNELIQSFNALLIPLYLLMLKNEQENIVLANKRDSLLPKLMSGELKTGDLHR
jgi:type I restriction enzyme S subunit